LCTKDLLLDLLDLWIRYQHTLEDTRGDRIAKVTLAQQAGLSGIGEITRLDGRGRDVRTHPQLRLGRHAVVRNLVALERLGEPSVDRLGKSQAVGLRIKMVAPLMAGSPLKALTCKLTNRRAPDAWTRFQRSEISTYSSPVRVRTTLARSFWSSVRSRKARSRVMSFSITLPTTTPGSQSCVGSLVGLPPCPGSIAIT